MNTPEPIGVIAARIMADVEFRHRALKVCRLGERATVECLAELKARSQNPDEVDAVIARYAGLDPAMLRALGVDQVLRPPIRKVA